MIDSYIKMRRTNNYDVNWFYKYFVSKGGKLDGPTFQATFHLFNLDAALDHLDYEFKLNRLYDKSGKLVGVFKN
jgi:hypothetical protein